MKGNAKVLDMLNELLQEELTASDQYFIHSRMYEDWGFSKLYERIKHEAEEEMDHASLLIERILFLEGTPQMGPRHALNIGSTVPEMLQSDLNYEYQVADKLRVAIKLCESENDYQTREVLEKLLSDTEVDHMYWLEQQLRLVKTIGLENYLQSQM